jgi:GH18 family chitinase
MKTKIYVLTALLISLFSASSYSQRISGYFPDYEYNAGTVNNIQYTKLTHLLYFSLNPWASNNGTVPTTTTIWFNLANFNAVVDAAKTANPNIKIIIVTGGAPASGDGGSNGGDLNLRLRDIANNTVAGSRAQFVNDIGNFIQTYSRTVGGVTYTLDGWDLDWEFPNYLNGSPTDTTNFRLLLQQMRTKLNTVGGVLCKDLEMSIAINGEPSKFQTNPSTADYLSPGVIYSVNYVNVMTYDANVGAHANYGGNHAPLVMAQEAVTALTSPPFNWPKSKLQIGIPFYGRQNGGTISNYSTINSSNSATIYANDVSGVQSYNGCNTITAKVNYVKAQGLAGVFIWELMLDRTASPASAATNSLLSCIYSAVGSTIWTAPERPCCQKPALGNDVATCNTAFPVTLNSNTTTAGTSVNYTWTRILPSVSAIASGSTLNTQSITAGNGAGTYVVVRNETVSGVVCSRSDTIVINAALPTPVFSPTTISLCNASYALTPTNLTAFPSGTTFQWQFNSSNISGATTSTFYASTIGTYTLVTSLTGCTNTSASVTVTAGSGTAVPVDGCRTTAGTLTLSVTGGTGPFNWYSQDSPGGSILAGGASTSTYTTPSLPLPSTTYYYVEDEGVTGTSYSVGIPTSGVCGACAQNSPISSTGLLSSIAMEFSVTNAIRIRSVDLYAWGGSTYPFTYQIQIFNQNNTVVYTSPNITYATSGLKTEILNASLSPGVYRMRTLVVSGGATPPAFLHESSSTFPYTGADISITAEKNLTSYGPFLNWQISNVNGCNRIKVKATVAASCPSPLPVSLLQFNANKKGSAVLLDWATVSELTNDRFEIERSEDGVHFVKIGTVGGAGNSTSILEYHFSDSNPIAGINYYRLKQIDVNAVYAYSNTLAVDMQAYAPVRIAPNPFNESFSINFELPGRKNISVLDISGAELFTVTTEANSIDIGNNLKAGMYLLKVGTSEDAQTFKIIKY